MAHLHHHGHRDVHGHRHLLVQQAQYLCLLNPSGSVGHAQILLERVVHKLPILLIRLYPC